MAYVCLYHVTNVLNLYFVNWQDDLNDVAAWISAAHPPLANLFGHIGDGSIFHENTHPACQHLVKNKSVLGFTLNIPPVYLDL